MVIVNYLPIMFPVSLAMTDGDVIRLNRMYKCGPAYNTGDNPPAQTIPTTTTTQIEKQEPEQQRQRHRNSSILGIFIFKIIPED